MNRKFKLRFSAEGAITCSYSLAVVLIFIIKNSACSSYTHVHDAVLNSLCVCVCVCMRLSVCLSVCVCAGEVRCWALVEDLSEMDDR